MVVVVLGSVGVMVASGVLVVDEVFSTEINLEDITLQKYLLHRQKIDDILISND